MKYQLPVIRPEWLEGITMTSEQKTKWLAALRSGDYTQGESYLNKNNTYCCLGVAEAIGLAKRVSPSFLDAALIGPPDRDTLQDALANINDAGVSFSEIADFIETNIPACDEVRR